MIGTTGLHITVFRNLDHNYTPFELVFGKKLNTFEIIQSKTTPLYNYESFEKEMKYRLQIAHTQVLDAIQKTKTKRTIKLNENVRNTDIIIGDIVYLAHENRTKLDQVNSGPYTVINTTESNATIRNSQNKYTEVHKSRLIKFKS